MMLSITKNGVGLALLATAALAGCSGSTTTATPAANSIMVNSDSGTVRAVDGTWTNCSLGQDNVTKEREEIIFSGNSLTINKYSGASSATYPCTGGTLVASDSGTFALSNPLGLVMSGGWAGTLNTPAPAPAKAAPDGTLLAAKPNATVVTIDGSIGGKAYSDKFSLLIDDSASQYRLYWGSPSAGTACVNANGQPICLWSNDPYYASSSTATTPTPTPTPTPTGLTFTNGDGIPALTGVPVLPASWTAANAGTTPSFNVTVPVDADTTGVMLMWGVWDPTGGTSGTGALLTEGSTSLTLTTPGTAQDAAITITPWNGVTVPLGASYQVMVYLCGGAGACNFATTGPLTAYLNSVSIPGTYLTGSGMTGIASLPATAEAATETGVTIPLMTVN